MNLLWINEHKCTFLKRVTILGCTSWKTVTGLLNTSDVPDVFILKVNLRLKEKNADHRSVVRNNRLKRAGSWWGQVQGRGSIDPVWPALLSVQPSSASKATTSMKCETLWARTCSTLWRRTTVWIGSAAAPCAPSTSTSWTTSARRSSPSPGRSSACPASSPAVYKRWAELLWLKIWLFSCHTWRV